MLRIQLLQQWYDPSDPAMEDALIEVPTMRRFAGIDQGIEKRPEMAGRSIGFRVAMRPGKRRVLPDTPEGRLDDLNETAKAHIRAKGEHPFRVIKQQFGSQKTRLRRMLINRCKVNVLAALSNLFMARCRLLCST
jgi:IS5 family transposase